MADYRITTPDGAVYQVTAPDSASQDEVLARVKAEHAKAPAASPKASTAPAQRPRMSFGDQLLDVPREVGHEFMQATRANEAELRKPYDPRGEDKPTLGVLPSRRTASLVGNTLAQVGSLVTGPATSIFGRPIEDVTGIPRETTGNLLAMLTPVGEEAAAAGAVKQIAKTEQVGAKVAEEILATRRAAQKARMAAPKGALPARAAPASGGDIAGPPGGGSQDPEHVAAVKRLVEKGVELTPGKIAGGMTARIEEAAKSNPYVGQAVRDNEAKMTRSFNRAAYNEALAPLGEKVTKEEIPDNQIGRKGVDAVERKISAAYERILPKVKFVPDDTFRTDVSGLQAEASILPAAKKAQLRAIIQDRVMRPMRAGTLTGREFKTVESDLTHIAGDLRGAQDPWDRRMGDMIEDLQGHMRSQLERSSDPGVKKLLQANNKAWAAYTRIRTAAANRVLSGGVFTPGDLLAAVKRGDRSAGKGAFARGDALLQGFADDAGRVIPNRLPDSGTPERLAIMGRGMVGAGLGGAVGGLPGAVLGGVADLAAAPVTNRLAGALLDRHAARSAARLIRNDRAVAPQGQNYLAQATARAGGAGGAARSLTGQNQGGQP